MSIASMSDTVLVTVKRPTLSTDGWVTRTYANHLTNVPMKIDEVSASESRRYERESLQVSHVCYTEGYPDIQSRDRLVWTDTRSDGTTETRTFEITGRTRQSRPSGMPHHTKLFAFEEDRT